MCGAETSCGDGLDNDSDGFADCADPDCASDAGCVPATFAFTDTSGDDVAAGSLHDFFFSVAASSADYLFFSLGGPGVTDYQICAQRADFYRTEYLAMTDGGGGAISSGSWSKWSREEGGAWSAPQTASFQNLYGTACVGFSTAAWCPEWDLAAREVGVFPDGPDDCESGDFAVGCSPGDWTLTIKVGKTRLLTCGF